MRVLYGGYGSFVTLRASFFNHLESVAARVSLSLGCGFWFHAKHCQGTVRYDVPTKCPGAHIVSGSLVDLASVETREDIAILYGFLVPHLIRREMSPNRFQNGIKRRTATHAGGVHKHRLPHVVAVQQSITALPFHAQRDTCNFA